MSNRMDCPVCKSKIQDEDWKIDMKYRIVNPQSSDNLYLKCPECGSHFDCELYSELTKRFQKLGKMESARRYEVLVKTWTEPKLRENTLPQKYG